MTSLPAAVLAIGDEEDVPTRLFRIVEADRQQPGTRHVGDGSPTPWMRCRVVTIGVALPGTVSVYANAANDRTVRAAVANASSLTR